MNLQDLFKDGILELPLTRNKGISFVSYLNKVFDDFSQKVNEVYIPLYYSDEERKKVFDSINGIKKSISLYLNGGPQNAYNELKKTLDSTSVYNYLLYDKIEVDSNFYRLRVKELNYPLSKSELFHVPFHLRHLIGTQRYSITGFPCLYLANSVYVAWEEMRRPKLNDIQAVRLKNVETIEYIDLTTDIYTKGFDVSTVDDSFLAQQLVVWPLKAICSIKVLEDHASFKPEYIIPQLLLQWLRDEQKQDAIKFSSTHINLNNKNSKGTFYNLVIPVKTNKDNDYCDNLNNMFTMTDVVSWQLYQIGISGATFSYSKSDVVNNNIDTIEVIPGMSYPYDYSPLANLERMLNFMKDEKMI